MEKCFVGVEGGLEISSAWVEHSSYNEIFNCLSNINQ